MSAFLNFDLKNLMDDPLDYPVLSQIFRDDAPELRGAVSGDNSIQPMDCTWSARRCVRALGSARRMLHRAELQPTVSHHLRTYQLI